MTAKEPRMSQSPDAFEARARAFNPKVDNPL
jgi:hypothetical protein